METRMICEEEKKNNAETENPLQTLCDTVRTLCGEHDFKKCRELICEAMGHYPDAAEPHNLFGIVLEKTGDHVAAMKHFRAAWALDPSYQPASENMHRFASFFSSGRCAFDESDLRPSRSPVLGI